MIGRVDRLIQRQHTTIVHLKEQLIDKEQDIKLIKKELKQARQFVYKSDNLSQYEKETRI